MPKPTIQEIWRMKGMFVNTDNGTAIPQPEEGFPIVAGDWPCRFVDAVRVPCSVCERPCGISPNGFRIHQEKPEQRPIWCPLCFELLLVIDRTAGGKFDS